MGGGGGGGGGGGEMKLKWGGFGKEERRVTWLDMVMGFGDGV